MPRSSRQACKPVQRQTTWRLPVCTVMVAALAVAITTCLAQHQLIAEAVPAEDIPMVHQAVTSPRGIPFLHRFDDSTPFAAISFGWGGLQAATLKEKQALPEVAGSLILQGADGTGLNAFSERLADLGASATLNGGPLQFTGSVRAPASKLAEAMALTLTAATTAQPSEKVFQRVLQRVRSAEAQNAVRADANALRAAMTLALGDHPAVRALDPARHNQLAAADLAAWRTTALDKSRLRVVASGRLSAADAADIVDRAFADLPAHAPLPAFTWPAIALKPRTIVIEHATRQSAIVLLGAATLQDGRDMQIAAIVNGVLGAGGDARLSRAVRGDLGATYGASSSLLTIAPATRLVRMAANVDNDKVAASLEAMRKTYAVWHAEGLKKTELTWSVTGRINTMERAFSDPQTANGLALGTVLAGLPIELLQTTKAFLHGLTDAHVNTFIKMNFPAPDQLVTVIVTPSALGIAAGCVVRALAEVSSCRQ